MPFPGRGRYLFKLDLAQYGNLELVFAAVRLSPATPQGFNGLVPSLFGRVRIPAGRAPLPKNSAPYFSQASASPTICRER